MRLPALLRRKPVAALAAAALVGTTGAGYALERRSSAPPATTAWSGMPDGDGLHRYVVTLGASRSSAGSATTTTATSTTTSSVDPAAYRAAVAALGAGGALTRRSGVLVYARGDRAVPVGVRTSTHAAPPAPVARPVDVSDSLQALAAVPGVVSAQRVSPTTALVATSGGAGALEAVPGVGRVSPSPRGTVAFVPPSDPGYAYSWHFSNNGDAYQQSSVAGADVHAPRAWDSTLGQGQVVAVIDTGWASANADLAGALWSNPGEVCGGGLDTDGDGLVGDCHGWNFYTGSAQLDQGFYGQHGGWVAGAVAARIGNAVGSAGIAPAATVMPLVAGNGTYIDITAATAALRYAVDHGAKTVVCSFDSPADDLSFHQAVAYAAAHDVLVVAAAGNDGQSRDGVLSFPASWSDANIVTVAASDALDRPVLQEQNGATWSSAFGATSVDLYAPGRLVYTTGYDGGFRLVDGTSMAAPLVAGAAALYRSLNPGATAAQVKAALLAHVRQVPALAGLCVSGGVLDVSFLGPASGSAYAYQFSGAGDQPSGTVHPVVTISGGTTAPDAVRLTLAVKQGPDVLAVAGAGISVGGTTWNTAADGSVTVPVSYADGTTLRLGIPLPDGQYALLAQLQSGGVALTRPYAAPVTVGAVHVAPTPTPAASGTAPSSASGSASASASATSSPGHTSPPAPSLPSPTSTGASAGATAGPPSTGSASASSSASATSSATSSASATTSAAATATATASSTASASGGATSSASASSSTGATASAHPTASTPTGSPVLISSVSPNHLQLSQVGTWVTIVGSAFPTGPTVLLGTSPVTVISASDTSITFRSPAFVAGSYDVTVSGEGRQGTLAHGFTYATTGSAPLPSFGAPGASAGSSTSASATAAPSSGSTAAASASATATAGSSATASASAGATGTASAAPSASASGGASAGPTAGATSTPAATPGTVTTVRFVASPALAGLDQSVFAKTGCDTGCAGLQV
ncbi:IPT/TIG domain-containing protein [Motilibacter rhizosphaerae]|uniref:IPT/TIG domain-containing protein n=1 Tax=Motilibacter rhizosphaerae TaxID=598652 RepID=A0A4Q7NAY3_9ACTN|nr:S8 family serine peptidase [Motilibacter rhizosphaerae]RZS80112.1 IPT/TIG domain-containing protein [Motilibacter rhizosphaerae]